MTSKAVKAAGWTIATTVVAGAVLAVLTGVINRVVPPADAHPGTPVTVIVAQPGNSQAADHVRRTPAAVDSPASEAPPIGGSSDTDPSAPARDKRTITSAQVFIVEQKVAPNTYRQGSRPGFYAKVFTAAGELGDKDGCYVHWELTNNGTLLGTSDTTCGLTPGWGTAYWPSQTKYDIGSATIKASITTDWGATAEAEQTFQIVPG